MEWEDFKELQSLHENITKKINCDGMLLHVSEATAFKFTYKEHYKIRANFSHCDREPSNLGVPSLADNPSHLI
jgi:hypothetical protein